MIPWSHRGDQLASLCLSGILERNLKHVSWLYSFFKIVILATVMLKSMISFKVLVLYHLIIFVLSSLNHALLLSGGTCGKEPACQCRLDVGHAGLIHGSGKPQRREWQSTPVFLPGESHGQRSLVGYTVHRFAPSITWLKQLCISTLTFAEFWDGPRGKESTCNAGDSSSIPGLGRSPGEENGNPLQYSCLENPMDRGAWQAMVYRVSKSQTWLKWFS